MVTLRDYQIEARNAVWSAFKAGTRSGLLILPTGAGKTVTCGSIIEPLHKHGKRVLFVVHRKELLKQAKATFERMGLTCAYEKADERVDPAALPDVTLASVQSLRGARLERFASDAFYVVVIDEGHRGQAASYKTIVSHFSAAKVLALTATPDRGDGKPLSDTYEAVLYRMEIGDAVRRGILCPIELLDVAVESLKLDDITTRAGDYAAGELEAEILKDSVLHGMAKPLAEQAKDRRICAFLPGVASAHRFIEVAAEYGLTGVAVDGGMDDKDREAALFAYDQGAVQMIACADLLSEGWDSPATDCVALCSPTKSRSRIIQRIGRGTRLYPGKGNLLVVNFAPGTVTKKTMVGPEDALAGCPMTRREDVGYTAKRREADMVAALVAEETARLDANAKLVRTVGVEYAVTRLSLIDFVQALGAPGGGEVSERQIDMLERMGFERKKLNVISTSKQASAVIEAVNLRRDKGLCTPKQAARLAAFGYRDSLSKETASHIIGQLVARNWKPIESKEHAARRTQ